MVSNPMGTWFCELFGSSVLESDSMCNPFLYLFQKLANLLRMVSNMMIHVVLTYPC